MMTEYGEDLFEDMKIDRFALEKECEKQALIHASWAESLAGAKAERDQEEDRLKLILGQREMAIRANPPEGVKITEGVIAALVASDTEVMDQKEAYRIACSKVYHLEAAVGASEHRRSQLSNLVQLNTTAYYSNKNTGEQASSQDMRRRLNKENNDE